jgi:Extensin-like protein C-terminus
MWQTRTPLVLILLLPVVALGCSSSSKRGAFAFPKFPTWSSSDRESAPYSSRGGSVRPSLAAEERACLAAGYVRENPNLHMRSSLGGLFSVCGATRAFVMSAAAHGAVTLSPPATLRCPMIPAVERWIGTVVRPAARRYLWRDLKGVTVIASYSCRTRNSIPGAKLSEHGRANAIDVSAFHLSDGRVIKVKSAWHSWGSEGRFVHAVHRGACRLFTTVLGPSADRYHHDHFHLDLARHGRDGNYRVCQ